ncbi:hypothetical protein NKI32_04000 [Mesorhizobium sp. M0761]|uniref:hypothetical protein n=1 Tax=Mesorhizobium sp. M0761 TaxID=2956994 RepID=UPI00333D5BB8
MKDKWESDHQFVEGDRSSQRWAERELNPYNRPSKRRAVSWLHGSSWKRFPSANTIRSRREWPAQLGMLVGLNPTGMLNREANVIPAEWTELVNAMSNLDNGEHLWALALADLRKEFGKFAQEHGTTPLEWDEHTKLFLEERRERRREPDLSQPLGEWLG